MWFSKNWLTSQQKTIMKLNPDKHFLDKKTLNTLVWSMSAVEYAINGIDHDIIEDDDITENH